MFQRRTLAVLCTTFFVAMSFAPLAQSSTGPTTAGDVIINGNFADTSTEGYPFKFYCSETNPTDLEGPNGECAADNAFVAYDWTTAVEMAEDIWTVDDGLRLDGNVFIQQHFNGTDAPDRPMQLYRVVVEATSGTPEVGNLRIEVRGDGNADGSYVSSGPGAESYTKTVTVGTTRTTVEATAAELGFTGDALTGPVALRSVRLWHNGPADITIHRVSVFATNGIEARNIHITPAGDDVQQTAEGALLLSPGADGVYSFRVGMAGDDGTFLPTKRAWLCLFSAEQSVMDRGYPANDGDSTCPGAYHKLTPGLDTGAITRTDEGDTFLFEIGVDDVAPMFEGAPSAVPAFGVYAFIEADAAYDDPTTPATEEFRSGYLHVGRLAADAAGAGVSREFYGPSPVFVDVDANGMPDGVQSDNSDGYAVIIKPASLLADAPFEPVALMQAEEGAFAFDFSVYQYDLASGAGAPIALTLPPPANEGGIYFGLFDAQSATSIPDDASPSFWYGSNAVWTADMSDYSLSADGKTITVTIPASEVPEDRRLVQAFAAYHVAGGDWQNVAGGNSAASDFYSGLQTAAASFVVADALRGAANTVISLVEPPTIENTGTRFEGDVTVNGAFDDATPIGHPQKAYCTPYDVVGAPAPCPTENPVSFVAYDWTAPDYAAGDIVALPGGGLLIGRNGGDTPFVQQHFGGTEGQDRLMPFYGVAITANTSGASQDIRVDLRADEGGSVQDNTKRITIGGTSQRIVLDASDFGFTDGEVVKARSIRLWFEGSENVTLTRVEVHGKNGISPKNNWIEVAGDDELTPIGSTVMHDPGADGVYTWIVRTVDDLGYPLLIEDAVLCVYDYEGYPADGFSSVGGTCPRAIMTAAEANAYKTVTPEGVVFNVPVEALDRIATSELPAGFAVWASVEIDGFVGGVHGDDAWRPGFFNAGQTAAVTAHAGGAAADWGALPTPVLLDRNADGIPDYVQVDELDGYAVIITPQLATASPAMTVVNADGAGFFNFDVQVYAYDVAAGAPMDLTCSLEFGIFDAEGLVNGGSFEAEAFWNASDSPGSVSRVDATTCRVSVPLEDMPENTAVGAYAFYDVDEPLRSTPYSYQFGEAQSAFDFYGFVRTAAKDTVLADALRNAATPIFLSGFPAPPASPTVVVRIDAETNELTPLDGTLVVSDGGDGAIEIEYAMFDEAGLRTVDTQGQHAIAIYDAAGLASDGFQPGVNGQLEHAEWTGAGTLTADGWFRVMVPLSAFDDAQGPVGVWAWVRDHPGGVPLGRTTWYNVLKEEVASVDADVAEKALYEPTPIVVLDAELGIPKTLLSAMQGAGTDLISVTNPLVNPGFQLDLLVEGAYDNADPSSAAMTSPPWFFRLDDRGVGAPTDPRSTHEVAPGAGRLGDNALEVRFNMADHGKGLMLGQLLGNERGTNALVWKGATGAAFDVKTNDGVGFTVAVRYFDPETSTIEFASKYTLVSGSIAWQRVSVPLDVPADAHLLGFYLQPTANQAVRFYLDNLVIEGAKTALGDARTDLTDGYAMIIQPQDLAGLVQGAVTGASGDYYLYNVTVVDYTAGSPSLLATDQLQKAFGLRTETLQKELGIPMKLRGDVVDKWVAAIPAESVPETPAAPWAFVDAGDVYAPLGGDTLMQPASGYYSPVKNALAGTSFADQLDYAGTPVAFGAPARELIGQQSLRLAATAGGFQVFVGAESPFVETTTLTVKQPNMPDRTYPVTLARAVGDAVPGLVLTDAEAANATLVTADTLFTRGGVLVAGSPIPGFEVCRPDQAGCIITGAITGESLTFRSTSRSPTGEPLTNVWNFGDGSTPVTTTSATTTHAYDRPGLYTVNLTVQTPSGRSASVLQQVAVANRAPVIAGIDVSPNAIFTDSNVQIRARASDPDGGSLTYAWKVDGIDVPGVTGNLLRLTPSVLENTTGSAGLTERQYQVSVTVSDGQGGLKSGVAQFTVGDRPTVVAAPTLAVSGVPGATYALAGETLLVSVVVTDADDAIGAVDLRVQPPGAAPATLLALTSAGGDTWTGSVPASSLGNSTFAAVALGTTGPATSFEVRLNSAPDVAILGATAAQFGETRTFTVVASDPDGRGIAATSLVGENATVMDNGDGTFNVTFDQVGIATLTATATDANGAAALATLAVEVDDVIFVKLEMVRAPQTATEGYLVRVTVTDVDGAPLAGVRVAIEDYFEPLPAAVREKTVTTDDDGTREFRVEPELALLGLPLEHRLVATATVGDETASDELGFRNEAEPFAGLPLP